MEPTMWEKIKAWAAAQRAKPEQESPWNGVQPSDRQTQISDSMKKAFGSPQMPMKTDGPN